MQNLSIAPTIEGAFTKSTGKTRAITHPLQAKARSQVWAPPLFWGPWVEIFAQIGVTGPNPEQNITKVVVSFDTRSQAPSTFEVEIAGGDELVYEAGPGSALVTITGNVVTALRIRAKSHSLGQNIIVNAG